MLPSSDGAGARDNLGLRAAAVDVHPARPEVQHADVAELLAAATGSPALRVLWSASNQLQTNVVVLRAGEAVDPHTEGELDVTLTVLRGSGRLRHGPHGAEQVVALSALTITVLPAGTRRSIDAGPDGLAYLTAHRRRSSASFGSSAPLPLNAEDGPPPVGADVVPTEALSEAAEDEGGLIDVQD